MNAAKLRAGFFGLIVAVVFVICNGVYYVGVLLKSAFETLVMGRDVAAQLRRYEDDVNGRE